MTLIEMMAALAIASVVLAACLQVITVLPRSQRVTEAAYRPVVLGAALRNALQADMQHVSRVRQIDNGLEFDLRASLSPDSMELQHIPSLVRYELKQINQRTWLIRTQKALHADLVEMICPDVVGLSLVNALDSQPDSQPAPGDWQGVGHSLTLGIELPGQDDPLELVYYTQ